MQRSFTTISALAVLVRLHVSCNSASERWVKWNWWSRHRVNLTGISVLSTPENVQRLLQSEWKRDDRFVSQWHTDCCAETTHMLVSFCQADPCSLFQAESKSVWRALQWQIDPCAANTYMLVSLFSRWSMQSAQQQQIDFHYLYRRTFSSGRVWAKQRASFG